MKVKYSYHLGSNKDLAVGIVNELSKEFQYVSILATDVVGKTYRRGLQYNQHKMTV